MKISLRKLSRLLSVSAVFAGGLFLTISAEAQVTKVRKPLERQDYVKKGDEIEFGAGHYKPSISPFDDQIETHSVSQAGLGQASGGIDLKTLEARAGTFVNPGENGLGVGAAAQAHLVRITAGGQASTETIKSQGRDIAGASGNGGAEAYIGARGVAEAGLDFGKDPTLKATVGGFVGQNVSAGGDVRANILGGGLGANASVSAGVGAEGSAGLKFSKDGAKIGVGGFAGDSASGTVGFDVLGIGGGVTATGYAGVGAEISSQSSFEKGKLRIKGTLGAALGVGGKIDVDATLDLTTIETEGKALADNVNHFGKQAVEKIDTEVKQAAAVIDRDLTKFGNETKAVFEQKIPDAFNNAGNGIKGGFEKFGSDTKNFFEQDVKNAFNQAGGEVKTGTEKFGSDTKNFFENDVKSALNQAGQEIDRGVNQAVRHADQGLKTVGNGVVGGLNQAGNTIKGWFSW